MHQFWYLDELVLPVLEYLERADKSRLSRTCKRLFLLAIPLVWHRPSFRGLANLFAAPSGYRSTRLFARLGSLVWRNGKVQANWLGANESLIERLEFYGAYVRRLDIVEVTNGRADDFMVILNAVLLSDRSLEDVFPKLENLHVTVSTPAFASQAFRFGFPNLKYLSLTLIVLGLTDDVPGSRYSDFLPSVFVLPRLDNLQMYGRTTNALAEAVFLEQTAERFPALKKLSAPLMLVDSSFLGPLALMKGLEKLNIQLDSLPSVLATRCDLPALDQLSVTYMRVFDLQCLLEALCAPNLQTLQIKSNAIRITGAAAAGNTRAYRTLCNTIASSWPALRVFTLSGFPDIITSVTPPTPWMWDSFSPLLECSEIRTCTIQTPVKVDVSDPDLFNIASAWPYLTDLALAIPEGSIVGPPSATANGVEHLALKCRQLENLALSVNLIYPVAEAPPAPPDISPNLKVLRLDVHDCPPCDAVWTADLLKQLFPKLKRFRFATRKVVRDNPELDGADERRMESMKEIKARLGLPN
ncbi:hypothetical protein CALVIDRAFT_99462 [Calocera viscosa TUFC12733]|uniref:Uncharacterized protein n=1 Tax=Calocera viscosa (strain TUFC12733) TaxID=1330018 RepID=A0A167MK89_CALVF|nr:hypothetical protein CALVIDRAFT_99462 [Calocera viscosa TUFC12733]